jgi:hypothetical protein
VGIWKQEEMTGSNRKKPADMAHPDPLNRSTRKPLRKFADEDVRAPSFRRTLPVPEDGLFLSERYKYSPNLGRFSDEYFCPAEAESRSLHPGSSAAGKISLTGSNPTCPTSDILCGGTTRPISDKSEPARWLELLENIRKCLKLFSSLIRQDVFADLNLAFAPLAWDISIPQGYVMQTDHQCGKGRRTGRDDAVLCLPGRWLGI